MTTKAEIRKELDDLGRKVEAAWERHEQSPDYENGPFICPGVGVVGTCTSTAVYLASRLGGDVYGYTIDENDKAIVGEAEGGHDFVLIDGRYLVDFWARDTYEYQDLYDLSKPRDAKKARKMYGDEHLWTKMSPENFEHWESGLNLYK